MSPADLKSTRQALGLSAEGFARLVGVQDGRTVRRWEAGDREIPGTVAKICGALIASDAVRKHFGVNLINPISQDATG